MGFSWRGLRHGWQARTPCGTVNFLPQALFHDFFRFRLQAIQTPVASFLLTAFQLHRTSATWRLDFREHRGFLRETRSLLDDDLLFVFTLEHEAVGKTDSLFSVFNERGFEFARTNAGNLTRTFSFITFFENRRKYYQIFRVRLSKVYRVCY